MFVISATIVIGVLLASLFALAFITGKRFGILGLGLAAGTLLASQTLLPLETIFQLFQEFLGGISPAQATAILLLLAPSIILMFSGGSRYHSSKMKLLGALLYTVMAGFAILPFVMSQMEIPDEIKNVVMTAHTSALAIGVVIAVVDCFITRHHKKR